MPHRPPPNIRPRDLSVAFVSLGCPKNLVDSEKMLGLLAEDGIAITADHDAADAIVINTCGFLEASKTESLARHPPGPRRQTPRRQTRRRQTRHRRRLPRPAPSRTQLLEETPGIDALVGVFDRAEHRPRRPRLDQARRKRPRERRPSDLGPFHPVSTFIHKPTLPTSAKGTPNPTAPASASTPRHYAYLRISEGCNQGCTFCTIPSIRGRMRSKPLPDILAEAEELLADGAVELNLIGQDTTSYGSDIGYPAQAKASPASSAASTPRRPTLSPPTPSLSHSASVLITQSSSLPPPLAPPHVRLPLLLHRRHDPDPRRLPPLRQVHRHAPPAHQRPNPPRHAPQSHPQTNRNPPRKTPPLGPRHRPPHHLHLRLPRRNRRPAAQLLQFVKDFRFDNVGVFEYSPEPGPPPPASTRRPPSPPKSPPNAKKKSCSPSSKSSSKKTPSSSAPPSPSSSTPSTPAKKPPSPASPPRPPTSTPPSSSKNAPHAAPGDFLLAQITA